MNDRQSQSGAERRKFKRAPVSFTVLYRVKAPFAVRIQLGNRECDAIAQDIGEGGIGLVTNYEIAVGAVVDLKFNIYYERQIAGEENYRAFELDGDVRYCRTLPKEAGYRLGICFMNNATDDRNFISNYIKSQGLKSG
jgi:hypothetical protein